MFYNTDAVFPHEDGMDWDQGLYDTLCWQTLKFLKNHVVKIWFDVPSAFMWQLHPVRKATSWALEIRHPDKSRVPDNVNALYLGEGSVWPILLGYLIYFSLAFNPWPLWLPGNHMIQRDTPGTREKREVKLSAVYISLCDHWPQTHGETIQKRNYICHSALALSPKGESLERQEEETYLFYEGRVPKGKMER